MVLSSLALLVLKYLFYQLLKVLAFFKYQSTCFTSTKGLVLLALKYLLCCYFTVLAFFLFFLRRSSTIACKSSHRCKRTCFTSTSTKVLALLLLKYLPFCFSSQELNNRLQELTPFTSTSTKVLALLLLKYLPFFFSPQELNNRLQELTQMQKDLQATHSHLFSCKRTHTDMLVLVQKYKY